MGCKVSTVFVLTNPIALFYLNYVGCKVSYIFCIKFHLICFTLTMWDVKQKLGKIWLERNPGFTLTMWDVKILETSEKQETSKVLP